MYLDYRFTLFFCLLLSLHPGNHKNVFPFCVWAYLLIACFTKYLESNIFKE